MKVIVSVAVACLLLQARAADEAGNYAIWGKGQTSCFRYSKDRSAGRDGPYKDYIMGYLTAYNAVMPETYSISRNMNLDEIMAWLDEYCDANQMSGIEQSMLAFVGNHYEKRYRTPPSRSGR